jgi:hypothetical protein
MTFMDKGLSYGGENFAVQLQCRIELLTVKPVQNIIERCSSVINQQSSINNHQNRAPRTFIGLEEMKLPTTNGGVSSGIAP